MLAKLVRNLFRIPRQRPPAASESNGASSGPVPAHTDAGGDASTELLRHAQSLATAGRLNAALEAYRACMLTYPQSLDACLGAAAVLVDLWSMDEAVAAYERALELAPASSAIFSALLFHRHYLSPVDARQIFAAHLRYGAMMRRKTPQPRANFAQAPDPARRLRIGYVSPNFSRHSVGYFIEPVIRCHDREHYEVFCYYSHRLSDDTTQRIRALADGWRDVFGADDDAVERMIREDRIDILFDLAGHSKGNQLGVFARRPAPLQLTWLGYPDTTGLATVDYRISDSVADPASAAGERHTESLLRIDSCFVCYQPPPDAPPVVARDTASPIVFSSFNNIAKVNDATLRTWREVLAAVPGSRLALKSSALNFPDTVDRLVEGCERAGIDPARVELRGWMDDRRRHLEAYDDVDIALDTFPYNGTTTTCEALWMGVPAITLAGEVHMSRVGASLLRCVGLDELVARDAAGYVQAAVRLAQNAAGRASLRAELRARLMASSLLDHAGFTRQLEEHCRRAWTVWCEAQRGA